MKRWLRAALIVALSVAALCGAVLAMGRAAQKMRSESSPVAQKFFALCRSHDFARAHGLLSSDERERLSQKQLSERWEQFEAAHGALQAWYTATPQSGMASSVNLWPRWVDTVYLAKGSRSFSLVQLRLAPQDGGWRIEKMNIRR